MNRKTTLQCARAVAWLGGAIGLGGTAHAVECNSLLAVTSDSAVAIAQALLRGDKPPVRIVGDVQLAAEVNWLVDHVRWDIDEDLARIVGDAPAHMAGKLARQFVQALRTFVAPVAAAAPPVP